MRLIDADLLEPDADYDDGEFWAVSMTQIENAPTIEPEPKKGKWERTYRNGFGTLIGRCGVCGRTQTVDNFCQNCGARLEEAECG